MLNSAEAVILPPSDRAPPMTTTGPRCSASRRSRFIARARLVIGPRTATTTDPAGRFHHQVDDGVDRRSVADDAGRLEHRQVAQPLRPVEVAGPGGRAFQRAFGAAVHRGHPRGRRSGARSAHCAGSGGAGTLPPTVVTASSAGWAAAKARNSATASSTPGSQSMIRD